MAIYFISKFLPLIFSPLGITIILLIVCLFKKNRKLVFSALIILTISSIGIFAEFLWILLEYPIKRVGINDVRTAGAIVVLSGHNQSKRLDAGIELYNSKKSDKLIFTGGINPYSYDPRDRGKVLMDRSLELAIPSSNLYKTSEVLNTYEEAKATKKLFQKKLNLNSEEIILVTSAFHMKRAKKVFQREGFYVQPYPVDFKNYKFRNVIRNPMSWIPSADNLSKSSQALREFIGRVVYRAW